MVNLLGGASVLNAGVVGRGAGGLEVGGEHGGRGGVHHHGAPRNRLQKVQHAHRLRLYADKGTVTWVPYEPFWFKLKVQYGRYRGPNILLYPGPKYADLSKLLRNN